MAGDVELGFRCARCGAWHDELPFAYGVDEPAYWKPEYEREGRGVLGEEQCVIDDHFFVRGRIRIPVVDSDSDFEWGVWTTLSAENFERMSELWDEPGREDEPPYFGWLATELPGYPSTLNLKTEVWTQPVGERPLVEVEPTDHPLATDQRNGITQERAWEIIHRYEARD